MRKPRTTMNKQRSRTSSTQSGAPVSSTGSEPSSRFCLSVRSVSWRNRLPPNLRAFSQVNATEKGARPIPKQRTKQPAGTRDLCTARRAKGAQNEQRTSQRHAATMARSPQRNGEQAHSTKTNKQMESEQRARVENVRVQLARQARVAQIEGLRHKIEARATKAATKRGAVRMDGWIGRTKRRERQTERRRWREATKWAVRVAAHSSRESHNAATAPTPESKCHSRSDTRHGPRVGPACPAGPAAALRPRPAETAASPAERRNDIRSAHR